MHVYGLAMLLGKDSEICLGDIILRGTGGRYFSSVGDTSDHAWCRISGEAPVDVSLTVRHIYPDLKDVSLVYADRIDLAAPFQVQYRVNSADQDFAKLQEADELLIGYNEKDRYTFDLPELLNDPFQFLLPPPPGMRTFPEIQGKDVFHAITYHCYRMVTEEDVRALCTYRNPIYTIKGIMKFNPEARKRIEELMS